MSVTIDANILVYAWNEADPVHLRARDLMLSLLRGPELLYLFWPVLMGYLRIATHPAILANPAPVPEVMDNVAAMLGRPHVRTAGEEDGFWSLYTGIGEQARGNAVPDAHLVTLMLQHGVDVIYTRDRDFRRFEGIEPRDPFV